MEDEASKFTPLSTRTRADGAGRANKWNVPGAPWAMHPPAAGPGADTSVSRHGVGAGVFASDESSASPRISTVRMRYAAASTPGRNRGGHIKENQDAFLVKPRLMGLHYVHLFAVMDGHGCEGAKVSNFVRENLVDCMTKNLAGLPEDSLLRDPRQRPAGSTLRAKLSEVAAALRDSCRGIQAALDACTDIDSSASGTTLTFAVIMGRHMVTCNVGDSRIVLGSRVVGREAELAVAAARNAGYRGEDPVEAASTAAHEYNAGRRDATVTAAETPSSAQGGADGGTCFRVMEARALTVDQVPGISGERARIEQCGGRVEPLFHAGLGRHVGPDRVWSTRVAGNRPGLAMSRSIGDRIAADVGVICDPVVTYHFLRSNVDKWLILASDGVWEYMKDAAVINSIETHGAPAESAVAVCEAAQKRWVDRGLACNSPVIDDITALVVQLWPPRSEDKDKVESTGTPSSSATSPQTTVSEPSQNPSKAAAPALPTPVSAQTSPELRRRARKAGSRTAGSWSHATQATDAAVAAAMDALHHDAGAMREVMKEARSRVAARNGGREPGETELSDEVDRVLRECAEAKAANRPWHPRSDVRERSGSGSVSGSVSGSRISQGVEEEEDEDDTTTKTTKTTVLSHSSGASEGITPTTGSGGSASLTPGSGASAGGDAGVPPAPPRSWSSAAQVRSRLPRLAMPGSGHRITPSERPTPASTLGPPSAAMSRGNATTTPHSTTNDSRQSTPSTATVPVSRSAQSDNGSGHWGSGAAAAAAAAGHHLVEEEAEEEEPRHDVSVLDSEEQMPSLHAATAEDSRSHPGRRVAPSGH